MKSFIYGAAVCCVIFSIISINSCKKSSDSSGGGTNNANPPQSTPAGTPVGNATSQTIGPAGGTVTTPDGIVKLVFPANAVSSNTNITIQPVTNNCPGGNMLAYRFGPNGIKFNQPVTLHIHYPDSILNSTIPELMGIAVQDSSGFWKRSINFSNDTTQRIISAPIKHFTDYTMMELIKIQPADTTVAVNGQQSLTIQAYDSEDPTSATGDDFAADIKASNASIEWAAGGVVNGDSHVGTISKAPGVTRTAIYKAPAVLPSTNPVMVTATASNLNIKYNGHTFNKIIAYAHLTIVQGLYSVNITFQAQLNEGIGTTWQWSDKGTFDVYLDGNLSKVNNIHNSNAQFDLLSNNGTCTAALSNFPEGPVNILPLSHVTINPFANNVTIIFDSALSQSTYIPNPQITENCPGQPPGTLGGDMGPSFPAYVQFLIVDTMQKAAC